MRRQRGAVNDSTISPRAPGRNRTKGTTAVKGLRAGGSDVQPRGLIDPVTGGCRLARRGRRAGGLFLPPSECTHRPEGHPPRGLALAVVDVEPHPPRRAPVERPGAVLRAPRA